MKKKKERIGIISGMELMKRRSGKLNPSDAVVRSGTGYYRSDRYYDRKGKKNQRLKNQLKNYRSDSTGFFHVYLFA